MGDVSRGLTSPAIDVRSFGAERHLADRPGPWGCMGSWEWGVVPARVVDVKALSGDSSDNYKGCPGIGDKWARQIVAAHGTVPEVIKVAETTGEVCGSAKKAEAILENRDYILACYEVARINTAAPTHYKEGRPNHSRLERSLTQLRFHSVRSPHNIRRMLK